MKYIVFFSILLFLSSFSLNNNTGNKIVFSNQKISIEAETKGCNDLKNGINKEFVFLKFSNKTNKSVTVSFYTELYYNNTCYTCSNKEEYTFKVVIPANSSVQGDCSNKSPKLALFSKMLGNVKASELTNYSIKNIVTK